MTIEQAKPISLYMPFNVKQTYGMAKNPPNIPLRKEAKPFPNCSTHPHLCDEMRIDTQTQQQSIHLNYNIQG